MSEEKKLQNISAPDFNQFYTVAIGYVEYCVQNPKTKLTDKERDELSEAEIKKKEDELRQDMKHFEEQKKCFQQTFDAMCEAISKGGTEYLKIYVDALKKLYEDKSSWKRDIKSVLVNSKSLKLFRESRANMIELYPILVTVNKTFPVEDYSELSLSPKAAMYGSEVNKTAKGSTKKAPLRNEEIQAMLELFLQVKDYKRFGDWFMAILVLDASQIVDSFKVDFEPIREELRNWAYSQIENNESYKRAVMDALIKNKMLKVLFDAYVAQPALLANKSELEGEVKILEEERAKDNESHDERHKKQFAIIQEKDASIADLRQRLSDFDRCKQQLTSYIEKYQIQLNMNERITADNERRIKDMEANYDRMQDELAETVAQLGSLQTAHAALQSDFSLKNNELLRLREMASQKEETARFDIMRELVTGINEQFFYLTMFYLELKDTGKLGTESIELYADTLHNIDSVLENLGIKKIGVIDQKVAYDASMHISTDAKIANGEQVIVSGYGWKIGDDVYIKAPVEKGE